MFTVKDFYKRKVSGKKISMVTAYDYTTAKIINDSNIDTILVGDSVAMVMHGFESTISATVSMMETHTAAVKRGAPGKFIVGDMPFLSFRKGLSFAMETVERLMQAGANAIKLEGVKGHENIISHIVESGVPVIGHLGLTPQSIHSFAGYRVQGKDQTSFERILSEAKLTEELGVDALVLECVPENLGKEITERLSIPTIGIGAGKFVDGQVLVIQDLLGMNSDFYPKFVRKYMEGHEGIGNALNKYHLDVQKEAFPSKEESYVCH